MIVRAPERRTRVAPGAALDSSGSVWPATRITLSYLEPGVPEPRHPVQQAFEGIWTKPPPLERVLRVIEVDPVTGRALSMRKHERA